MNLKNKVLLFALRVAGVYLGDARVPQCELGGGSE